MSDNDKPVERLFGYAVRARLLLPGRERVANNLSKLQWVLLASDVSDRTRREVLRDFGAYPIVQYGTSAELAAHFQVPGAKVLGFRKSDLARSIYQELKACRLNPPGAQASASQPPSGASSDSG